MWEGMAVEVPPRNYRRAVESVLEGHGIKRSIVSRQFVAASSIQLRVLCDRRLEDLHLVLLMIDGIHFGGQVLVVALGITESGQKHVLGSDRRIKSTASRGGTCFRCTSGGAALPDTQVGGMCRSTCPRAARKTTTAGCAMPKR